MYVQKNALDFVMENPKAAREVERSFYVGDGLTGSDTAEEAMELEYQLQTQFER